MSRSSRFTFAALGGLGAVVAAAGIAGATTYAFTVPVTVTATKAITQATVTCAIGGAALKFNPGQGNVVRAASDASPLPPPTNSTSVSLHAGTPGTYSGQATLNVATATTGGTPTNYLCFATTGTNDAYTTAPVISGTLPVIVK